MTRSWLNYFNLKRKSESGVSLTTEILVFIPLAIMLGGFLVNGAIQWIGLQYVQSVTNSAAQFTANAGGDRFLRFIPGVTVGVGMKPSDFLALKITSNNFTRIVGVPTCEIVGATASANSIAKCNSSFKSLYIPTDPVSALVFNVALFVTAESLVETGVNQGVE